MKKRRILLALSLVGLLTGCGAPQQSENNNGEQQVTNGKDGIGIKSIALTGTEGNVDIYTITYTDNTTSIFKVTNGKDGAQGIQGEPGKDGVTPTIEIGENGNWIINGEDTGINANGSQGEKGDTGNGIDRIELTSTEDNVDTYIIYFTDGTEATFTVTNGKDGAEGIQGEPGEDGHSPVVSVGENGNWFIDGIDSGVKAAGIDGDTPYIGENGNWWIGDNDTGNPARGPQGDTGNGIDRIELTSSDGNVDTYTIYFTDGTSTTFKVTNGQDGSQGIQGESGEDGVTPTIAISENGNWVINGEDTGIKANGSQGEKGDTGNGIEKIELTSSDGNVDTYTIYFTDGTEATFTVTNGKDGAEGIQGEPGEDGHSPVVSVGENGNWFIDGIDSGVKAAGIDGDTPYIGENGNWWIGDNDTGNPARGPQGDTGNGIDRIELTSSDGNVDTYTIYFTDGTSTTFKVTNGTDGSQGEAGQDGIDGKSAYEIFKDYYPEYEGSEKERIDDVINGEFNKVKISFDVNGGTLDTNITLEIKKGSALGDLLPTPKKEEKEFLGWFTGWTANDVQITVNTPIYTDMTLVAKWNSYDVNFLDKNGSIFETVEVNHGEKVAEPLDSPTATGETYTFVRWDFDFNDLIYSDMQINSVWSANEEVIVTFGSYPQSVVSDASLKTELAKIESGTISGTVLEYDSDADGTKEKYLCQQTQKQVKADDGSKIEVGINYFKFESIEWRILSQDSNSYSVVSQRVLDTQYWNRNGYEYEDPETFVNETVYNNYEKSEIRTWLNDEFINTAFNEEEKAKIPTTIVDNGLESTLDTTNKYVCNDTEDKVYLLSRKEVATYPFSSNTGDYDENRIANATDYAKAMGVDGLSTDSETYGNCNWWTRSPYYHISDDVYFVRSIGDVSSNWAHNSRYGVRPALHINL